MENPFKSSMVQALKVLGLVFVLSLELLNPLNLERASAQTPFYQGKTVRVIVGTPPGNLYDLWARLIIDHMGKNIPGNPTFIVQNMPGAGHVVAVNHLFSNAKPDGLTLGAIYPALYFDQLIKKPEVKFDWGKWNWIGSPVTSNHLLYMRADTPYKTLEDVRKAPTAPKCGSTGISSTGYYLPKLLEEVLGGTVRGELEPQPRKTIAGPRRVRRPTPLRRR